MNDLGFRQATAQDVPAVVDLVQSAYRGDRILRKAEQTAIDLWGASAMRLVTIHLRNDVIAWYARRGFTPTGATHRFPYGDERYGRPNRDDLTLAEFEKLLDGRTG